MNIPGTQEALAAAQRVASFLAAYGNPFGDPLPSENQGGESSGKATIFYPIIADRVSFSALNLSWRAITRSRDVIIYPK